MKQLLFFLAIMISLQTVAQEKMRVTMIDGTYMDFDVNNVEDFIFHRDYSLNLVGEWVVYTQGDDESLDYYIFHENGILEYKTFSINREHFISYEGTYTIMNNLADIVLQGSTLSLKFESISDNQMISGNKLFCKIDERVDTLTIGDVSQSLGNDTDIIKFVDSYFVGLEDNKIKPLREGTGYALVEDANTKEMKAYKICVVSADSSIIDWGKYLGSTTTQIINEFGDPNQQVENKYVAYTNGLNSDIKEIYFDLDSNTKKVSEVSIDFYNNEKRQKYWDYIEEKYHLAWKTESYKIFYDSDDAKIATIEITIYDESDFRIIVYKDLRK